MNITFFRIKAMGLLVMAMLFGVSSLGQAQTAISSTTLDGAITALDARTVTLAASTTLAATDRLFVDQETMQVTSASTGTIASVRRGTDGSAAALHVTGALVYYGARGRFYANRPNGACTRTSEEFLPHIVPSAGEVYDCPVGTPSVWIKINPQQLYTAKSRNFNIDNGAGTTVDDVIIRHTRPIRIVAARIVYTTETTGVVAAGNAAVGVTLAGAEVVAATAYANTVGVGTTTAMVIVNGAVAANTSVFVRHTGVAAVAAGEAYIEVDYQVR